MFHHTSSSGQEPLRVNREQYDAGKIREKRVAEIYVPRGNCTRSARDKPATRRRGKIVRQREGSVFSRGTNRGEQENRTPEELFLEHFTAEPVRDEILEETMSDQIVMTTPASHPEEDWQQLRILEDSLTSAASSPE